MAFAQLMAAHEGGRDEAHRRSQCWGKGSRVHAELISHKKVGGVLRWFCVAARQPVNSRSGTVSRSLERRYGQP
jgi:hypothetical protein